MIAEIAYVLLATAAAAALLVVLLLAWHEFSGRASRRRYRSTVAAARLAIKQERGEERRARPSTTAGVMVVEIAIDTSKFDEQIKSVASEARRVAEYINSLPGGA